MNDRQLLDGQGIAPKKSLGQNFLHDPHTLEKIVALAELPTGATVLEIGPGTGNLTRALARAAGRVIAVEVDDRLIPLLHDAFADQPHIEIVHGDILTLDLAARLGDAPYTLVANLPYYITSAVLRHLLKADQPPTLAVVMVQREVAQRIVAKPGDMSLLAVGVQFYAEPRIVNKVPAGAFYPRPKVDSAVLRLDVRPQPAVPDVDPVHFFEVVRAGFSQKRKQLLNSLSSGLSLPKDQIRASLVVAGIDPQRRAETLSLDEWGALTKAVTP